MHKRGFFKSSIAIACGKCLQNEQYFAHIRESTTCSFFTLHSRPTYFQAKTQGSEKKTSCLFVLSYVDK